MLTNPIFIHICSEKISKKKSKRLKKKIRSVTELQLDKIDLQKVVSSPGRLMTGSESDLVQHAVKNEGMTQLHCTGEWGRILLGNKGKGWFSQCRCIGETKNGKGRLLSNAAFIQPIHIIFLLDYQRCTNAPKNLKKKKSFIGRNMGVVEVMEECSKNYFK